MSVVTSGFGDLRCWIELLEGGLVGWKGSGWGVEGDVNDKMEGGERGWGFGVKGRYGECV